MDSVRGTEASMSRSIEKLDSLLVEEPRSSLKGVERSEIRNLKDELAILRLYFRDIESNTKEEELSNAMKEWLNQSKEAAELVEDIVDECILKAIQRRHRWGLVNMLCGARQLIGKLNSRRNLYSDIQNIKAFLWQIKEPGQAYGLNYRILNSRAAVIDRYGAQLMTPVLLESTFGIDSVANELIERLVEGATLRSVISLVGIGGTGKTTLAAKVYENKRVIAYFDSLAWVTVTRSYNVDDLLRITVQHMGVVENQVAMMGREELVVTLRQYLRSKRYLLVFDDIWQEQFWQELKEALPCNEVGSKVIVTTRSEAVANSCRESSFDHVHRMEPLSKAMSWELFCNRAFPQEHQRHCPPELEHLSLAFIRVCEGLPFAIVAIAGLLSAKEKTVLEWKRVLEHFQSRLESDPHLSNVSQILALSYYDLPYHLRTCFIYFSIFAQDSLIPLEKLVNTWIAEGFVEERGRMDLEEVAEEYLNELVQRNLVQACQGLYGLEKFYRLHDLMYEIAQQKADKFSFCQSWYGENSSFTGNTRRLSISNNVEENVLETIQGHKVRSVFLSNCESLNNSFVVALFRKYSLLRLLDFENVPLDYLPEEVGNLFHLKYLSLKNTKVKTLPMSMRNLVNLQTLDLRNTLLVELPIVINKLQNLRQLLASGYDNKINLDSTQGERMKKGRSQLQRLPDWISVVLNLSMLCLGVSRLTDDPLRHVSVLPKLVSFWLYRAYEGERLHFGVGGFQKLKVLVLRDLQGLEVVEIEDGALPLLEELRIGPSPLLTTVPSGIEHIRSLKVLAFYDMPSEFVCSIQPGGGSDYWKIEHVRSVLFWYRFLGRLYALYELGDSELLNRLQGPATNVSNVVKHNVRLSLCYSDDEANSESATTSVVPWKDMQLCFFPDRINHSSDQFSIYTDDVEY